MADTSSAPKPGNILKGALEMAFNIDAKDFNDHNRHLSAAHVNETWGSAVSKAYFDMKNSIAVVAACFSKEVLDTVPAMEFDYVDFVLQFATWATDNAKLANEGFEEQAILFAKYATHDANTVKNFS